MTAKNEHTGALIQSIPTKEYQSNYDRIFRNGESIESIAPNLELLKYNAFYNQLLNDPIDGFNQTSPREDNQNGSKITQNTSG